jgi:hypothetical protein
MREPLPHRRSLLVHLCNCSLCLSLTHSVYGRDILAELASVSNMPLPAYRPAPGNKRKHEGSGPAAQTSDGSLPMAPQGIPGTVPTQDLEPSRPGHVQVGFWQVGYVPDSIDPSSDSSSGPGSSYGPSSAPADHFSSGSSPESIRIPEPWVAPDLTS